jgi:hypothetical protein
MNEASDIMQSALCYKREVTDKYILFLNHFGPALTGVALWNNNKTTKPVSEMLTVTDEAFIHLCIINYSATWKAQEEKKAGKTDEPIPVSDIKVDICYCKSICSLYYKCCQSPRFTKATNKGHFSAHNAGLCNLPCGWSKQGLQTFNQLAREIFQSRKEHGEEFNKAFKEYIEQEMASKHNTGKRKRNCIDTYNDLNEGDMIRIQEHGSDDENEGWVAKNLFIV